LSPLLRTAAVARDDESQSFIGWWSPIKLVFDIARDFVGQLAILSIETTRNSPGLLLCGSFDFLRPCSWVKKCD